MAWKRDVSTFEANPSGLATIKRLKGRRLGVTFNDANSNEFAGKKYKVSEWPEFVNPKGLPGLEWFVKLTNKGDEIYSIAPQSGFFKVRFKEFTHKDGEPPVPKFMSDWKYPETMFFAILEIVGDLKAAEGMQVVAMLPYRFDEDEDGNVKYTKVGERSNTMKLIDFMTYAGLDENKPMKFLENLLPKLQKRLLKADKVFGVLMKNGFVDSYSEVHDSLPDDNEDWEDDEVPFEEDKPKKKKKKDKDEDFDWD